MRKKTATRATSGCGGRARPQPSPGWAPSAALPGWTKTGCSLPPAAPRPRKSGPRRGRYSPATTPSTSGAARPRRPLSCPSRPAAPGPWTGKRVCGCLPAPSMRVSPRNTRCPPTSARSWPPAARRRPTTRCWTRCLSGSTAAALSTSAAPLCSSTT